MPTVSGEPESWPVVVSPNPEGNAGEAGASDHVYGSTPPVPVNCVVYATPTWAGGSETLVTCMSIWLSRLAMLAPSEYNTGALVLPS